MATTRHRMTPAQRRRLEELRSHIAAMPHNRRPDHALKTADVRAIARCFGRGEGGPMPT